MLAGHPTHVFLAVLLLIQLMNDANCQPGKSDHPDVNKNDCSNRFVYTRDQLTHLSTAAFDFQMPSDIPPEMRKRHRKRGKRGGVRTRCRRRGPRVPVPTVVSGNVRSLRNKMDELTALRRWNFAHHEASMLCLSETWLQENKDPDTAYAMDGFSLIRSDRDEKSGKSRGGGVCAYVNEKWCKNTAIFDKFWDLNTEYLTLS